MIVLVGWFANLLRTEPASLMRRDAAPCEPAPPPTGKRGRPRTMVPLLGVSTRTARLAGALAIKPARFSWPFPPEGRTAGIGFPYAFAVVAFCGTDPYAQTSASVNFFAFARWHCWRCASRQWSPWAKRPARTWPSWTGSRDKATSAPGAP